NLGLSKELLAPFILRSDDRLALTNETIGHTSLERRPIIDFKDELIIALPSAISPAIRRFLFEEIISLGYLEQLTNALSIQKARQVEGELLLQIKRRVESIEPPPPDDRTPSLHSWLVKYDLDKYLHVVLLHDRP